MATPRIPPRPTKAHQVTDPTVNENTVSAPRIPPRPSGRRTERSISPSRYAPSPLNEASPYGNAKNNRSASSIDVPPRPPSVNLPSIGQEGNEYGDIELHEEQSALEKTLSGNTTQTSHVHSELPLHAPRPSLSKSGAKAQIAAVTRTDSHQAAASGIGSATSPREDHDPYNVPLKSKTSSGYMRSGSSLSHDRPPSASQLDEHGIPHIGQFVPMLPNAGDVQAPSPAPGSHASGHDPPHDGQRQRHHGRKHSGREIFHVPPGSYGLHGHGSPHTDQFEKSWYAKHPDELAKEEQHGHYSAALSGHRPEFALSSNDLNKIVRDSAKGSGFGTSANVTGLPNEQIGYMASDQYTYRLNSPRSHSSKNHNRSSSVTHNESPLRQTNFPKDVLDHSKDVTETQHMNKQAHENNRESVIHIDMPNDEMTSSFHSEAGHESTGNYRDSGDAESGHGDDHGYSAPILASDELTPGSEWQQPAVFPHPSSRRGSAQPDDLNHLHRYPSHIHSASSSRPGSRPASIHGVPPLMKLNSHDEDERHTPLENVEEYEPLFPEDGAILSKKPLTAAGRLKRRPDMKQRFPSLDIWEDTPNSLRLETEVTSPETTGETPSAQPTTIIAASKQSEEDLIREQAQRADVITPSEELLAGTVHKLGLKEKRNLAALGHRFPSHDIWEDSPDFASLTTTVENPQEEEDEGTGIPQVEQIPLESKDLISANESHISSITSKPKERGDSQDNTSSLPQVPPRPQKKASSGYSVDTSSEQKSTHSADYRKAPTIPERPKPQVPPKPTKSTSRDSYETAALTKTASAGSGGSFEGDSSYSQKPLPPAIKSKPSLPARPTGGKIAALQADFMADLNSRLKIGPQSQAPQPKVEEAPEDKAPLHDARKSRARGPMRRKPGTHTSLSESPARRGLRLGLSNISTVWFSEHDGNIIVPKNSSELLQKEGSVNQPNITSASTTSTPHPLVTEPHSTDIAPSEITDAERMKGEWLEPELEASLEGTQSKNGSLRKIASDSSPDASLDLNLHAVSSGNKAVESLSKVENDASGRDTNKADSDQMHQPSSHVEGPGITEEVTVPEDKPEVLEA